MNAIVNIGTLIPFAISLSDGIKAAQNEFASIYVEIGAGIGANGDPGTFGGHVPAVALWNAQDGLHNIALSMHMTDFNGDTGLTGEFNDNRDLLRNSKARSMQWRELPANPGQDSVPPMFIPPLE
ncbi:hypothetical protein B0A48_16845 [Cryoendolithus antarcticus]|uniref:Uncharacterized protein n=1 Tax=Cryoendolithus antarcticus TaxID=1507870 RepID=A0A1V8SDX3_9PEZI|nr:hypothetical protein B0A48_16845 [Cryoendolithus antarcticus]